MSTCPHCHQLFEALESQAQHPDRRCPRCAVFTEALALLENIARQGSRSVTRLLSAHATRDAARCIVERARAL